MNQSNLSFPTPTIIDIAGNAMLCDTESIGGGTADDIYVCGVIIYNRVWINRVRLPNLLVVS